MLPHPFESLDWSRHCAAPTIRNNLALPPWAEPTFGPRRDPGVPIRTVSEMNGREHWTVKAKRVKLHRQAAWLCLAGKLSFLPCTVILTRIAPRTLDGDNLQASLKACRDGVADWLGVDDGDSRVIWRYAQRPGAPKQYAVEVAVEHDD